MDCAYVFDLGNVIISPMDTKLLYEMLEMKVSYDDFLKFLTKSKSSIDAHKGFISDDENIQNILEFCGSPKNIEEYKKIYMGPIRKSLNEDTLDIIENLREKNKRIYMLSNLRKIDFDYFSTVYDVSKFNGLFLSYEMHKMKPDLQIYLEMIDHLKVKPNKIYFFDDDKANCEAAEKCGINSYCVTGESIKKIYENNITREEDER